MSLNKKILAVAVLASLATSALAAPVVLSPATANTPTRYPTELVIPAARLTLTNNEGAGGLNQLDIASPFNYSFSAGEVRYARVECSNDVQFGANTTVDPTLAAGGTGGVTFGAINGISSSVITFSVTAGGAGASGAGFNVNGDRSVSSTGDATCSYSLYDTPSQAAAGGTPGRIVGLTGNYLDFLASYRMTSTATGATANVEAPTGAYTSFLVGTNNVQTVSLGNISTALTFADIWEANGSLLAFNEIIGATSTHTVSGDFTFAAAANGTYAVPSSRVTLDPDALCTDDGDEIDATSLTATTATFPTGATPLNHYLCVTAANPNVINEADYRVTWNVVSADATKYTTPNVGPQSLGSIVRNGTQLQAPLVQSAAGYISRIALTNSGNAARAYTVRVIDEEGNPTTRNPAGLSGTIAANSSKVVDVSSIITGFTTATRATIIVTVAAPNTQIQGLYQIVNPAQGSISNHVMVRPGTN